MENENFVTRHLQTGKPVPIPVALEAVARKILDDDGFIVDVAAVFKDYRYHYGVAKSMDATTATESQKVVKKISGDLAKIVELMQDTMELIGNQPPKVKEILNTAHGFDEVASMIARFVTSGFDAAVGRFASELEKRGNIVAPIGGGKEVTEIRRSLLGWLQQVFSKYGLSTAVYAKDGQGNPSQLAEFASQVAAAAGDAHAKPRDMAYAHSC